MTLKQSVGKMVSPGVGSRVPVLVPQVGQRSLGPREPEAEPVGVAQASKAGWSLFTFSTPSLRGVVVEPT